MQIMKRIWISLISLIFFVMHANGDSPPEFDFEKIILVKRDAYVVPEQQAARVTKWIDEMMVPLKHEGYWTPDANLVKEADVAARHLIDASRSNLNLAYPILLEHPERFPKNWKKNAINEIGLVYKNQDQYSGQFMGYVVDGRKRIYCNYFSIVFAPQIDPSHRFVAVNDGGYGFWQVQYDIQTKTCLNLSINGPWALDY